MNLKTKQAIIAKRLINELKTVLEDSQIMEDEDARKGREISIKVYKFEELSEKAKEVVREDYRVHMSSNDYSIHYQDLTDDWEAIADTIGTGFSVNESDTNPYRVDFDLTLYYKDFIEALPTLRENFPDVGSLLSAIPMPRINPRVSALDISVWASPGNGWETDLDSRADYGKEYSQIEAELKKIGDYLQNILSTLETYFIRALRSMDEWLMSDEYIDETIMANEWEFYKDGRFFRE